MARSKTNQTQGIIPNFINGVSQQPAAVRLPTQVEAQVNAYSTVTNGLIKRPPARHLALLSGFPTTGARYHTINRDVTERYEVAIVDKDIKIVDMLGAAKTVNTFATADLLSRTIVANSLTSFTAQVAVGNGTATGALALPAGLTSIYCDTTGSGTNTVLIQESTTGAFGGEETTKATITTNTTTTVAAVFGRFYRARMSVFTSGSRTAIIRYPSSVLLDPTADDFPLRASATTFSVITAGTFVGTFLVQESTTGLWAGEETTLSTITTATTTVVTGATSGRFYRVKMSVWTSGTGSATATMRYENAAYLDCSNPKTEMVAVTVADYTFILNKTITMAAAATTATARPHEALINVISGTPSKSYTILIDGAKKAEYRPGNVILTYDTTNIAQILMNGALATDDNNITWTSKPNGSDARAVDVGGYVNRALNNNGITAGNGYTVTRYGSAIHISHATDFTISVEDGQGGTAMVVHKDTTDSFATLPRSAPDGFVVKIRGDSEGEWDDYYVKFVASTTAGVDGTWVETCLPGVLNSLDASTMYHTLVREADGTFTFGVATFGTRDVGDLTSVPWPSFVGKEGTDLAFYKNRLGVTADENTIMSQAGNFFDYFPDTVTAQLDTDPIDVAITYPKVSIINYAVPYNEQLLLFSGLTQFRLRGDELLTPKTANITQLADYRSDPGVRPAIAGTSLFFAIDEAQSTSIREFTFDPQTGAKDGPSVTDHCDRFLPASLSSMAANGHLNLLAAASDEEPRRVYVYKYYTKGSEKLQSSWSYWDFGASSVVHAVDFIDNDMIVLITRGAETSLESIPCDEGFRDTRPDLTVNLDRRLVMEDLVSSYSAITLKTTFTLPYLAPADIKVVTSVGAALTVSSVSSYSVVVNGDHTASTGWLGIPYEMRVRLSEIVPKTAGADGQTAVVAGQLTVQHMTITVGSTGYFTVEVGQTYRDTYTHTFTGTLLGDGENLIGSPAFAWQPFRFSVMAVAGELAMDLVSSSYLPCAFLNAEWQGVLHRRN